MARDIHVLAAEKDSRQLGIKAAVAARNCLRTDSVFERSFASLESSVSQVKYFVRVYEFFGLSRLYNRKVSS